MEAHSSKDKTRQKKVTDKSIKKTDKKKAGVQDLKGAAAANTVIASRPCSDYDLKSVDDVFCYWQKKDVVEGQASGNGHAMNKYIEDEGKIYGAPDEDYFTINEANLDPESVYHQNIKRAREDRSKSESFNHTEQGVCDDYGTMVTVFKSLIVKKVIIGQLLPHLTFIDDHAKWHCRGNNDPRKAMQEFIDEMLNCRELGKWRQFIEALSSCGYSYIVENIKGYKVIDSEYQEEYLKIMSPLIRGMIEPMSILPNLLAKFTITDEDKEEVVATKTRVGSLAASDMLLDRVPRKHALWYQHLLESFKETGRDDIAEYLDIPEMMVTAKQSKHANPNDERTQNPYSIMTTYTSRSLSDQERRLRTKSSSESVYTEHNKANISERKSLPINLQRQASEPHIYDPSWRHERSSSEDSNMQYTALEQDNEQYDDAQSALTINVGVAGICILPNQEETTVSTPPQSEDALGDLDHIYRIFQDESQKLSNEEQMLDRIEAKRKENLAKKLANEKRKERIKRLLSQDNNDTPISQGPPIVVEEDKECQDGTCQQNASKTLDLKSK